MPEIVACPECNGKLRVPDESLGKKVKCPKCSKTFVAEIEEDEEDRKPARPARRKDDDDIDFDAEKPRSRKGKSDDVEIEFDDDGDDDDDDGPGKKKKKKTGGGGGAKGGWKSVSLGLMLVMVSALIWAGIILINNSEGTLFYLTKNTSVGTGVTWATFLLAFVYMGVNLAGQVINLGTPGAAKSLALGTLITTGIAYIAITIGLALYYPAVKTLAFDNLGPPTGPRGGMEGMGMIVGGNAERAEWMFVLAPWVLAFGHPAIVLSFLMMCFYLYTVAAQVEREDLGRQAILVLLGQTLLTVGGKLIVMAVALFLSYILLKEAKDPRAAGQTVNWLMYFFEAFVWLLQFGLIAVYVLTVSQIRNAAVSYSRRKK